SGLELNFRADKVFLVIRPNAKGDRIKLFIDGRPVDDLAAGADVKDGQIVLDTERLYGLIDLKGKVESHLLRLEFQDDGISVYAFTFG
ncbi:MAG: cytochrome c biogenesis protein DipZ, partial [Candidatus Omnitrophica bacterium]|nr:cytochrome c biogenesis protein DipZ [Candidatus Omnitrophota bacterium]